jgi:chromosome segregation ATPase
LSAATGWTLNSSTHHKLPNMETLMQHHSQRQADLEMRYRSEQRTQEQAHAREVASLRSQLQRGAEEAAECRRELQQAVMANKDLTDQCTRLNDEMQTLLEALHERTDRERRNSNAQQSVAKVRKLEQQLEETQRRLSSEAKLGERLVTELGQRDKQIQLLQVRLCSSQDLRHMHCTAIIDHEMSSMHHLSVLTLCCLG